MSNDCDSEDPRPYWICLLTGILQLFGPPVYSCDTVHDTHTYEPTGSVHDEDNLGLGDIGEVHGLSDPSSLTDVSSRNSIGTRLFIINR